MKTEDNLPSKSGETKETRAQKAIRLLTTATGSPFNQKLDDFRTFYPAVVAARRNGMKNKQIIKILAEGGLKLYPALFEKLMSTMENDRDATACPHCGQAVTVRIEEAEIIDTTTDDDPTLVQADSICQEGI